MGRRSNCGSAGFDAAQNLQRVFAQRGDHSDSGDDDTRAHDFRRRLPRVHPKFHQLPPLLVQQGIVNILEAKHHLR